MHAFNGIIKMAAGVSSDNGNQALSGLGTSSQEMKVLFPFIRSGVDDEDSPGDLFSNIISHPVRVLFLE